ncbi:MAG: hypothetical protein CMN77_10125 [Spirochaetaceae bacterium]|nr:hypothetical protein [Spirochaetaceae bacterium]
MSSDLSLGEIHHHLRSAFSNKNYRGKRSHGSLFAIILFALAILLPAAVRAEQPSGLTLNDIYLKVLKRSEQDQIQQQDLAIAEARYKQSLSSYYPEIFLFGRKTYNDRYDDQDNEQLQALIRQQQNQNSTTSSTTTTGTTARVNDPYQVGAGFRWPIFSGFQTYHESRARDAERISSRYNRQRFRELLFRDVGEVYFQVLEYRKTIQILQEEQAALRGRIGELARRVNIGRSSQGELLAAQSEYSSSRIELERIKGLEATSLELLAFLMAVPAEEIVLADPGELPSQDSLTAYLEKVEDRKDLRAAMKSLEAERSRMQVEEGGHYPQANVEGSYYASQKPDYGRDWGITLSIEIPIFQGGNTYYSVKESRAQVRKSELQLEALKRSASYEIRSAYVDYINSLSRLALLRESVQISRATYYVQVRDYRLGIVTNLEVLNALRGFHAARRELTRMEMLVRMNEIRLHVAAGMDSHIPDPPAGSDDTEIQEVPATEDTPREEPGTEETSSEESATDASSTRKHPGDEAILLMLSRHESGKLNCGQFCSGLLEFRS